MGGGTVWLPLPPFARLLPQLVPQVVQLGPVRLLKMDQQESLVDPVNKASWRYSRVQDDVHQIHGGEVLHVLDAFLGKPCLIPEVESVELVERVFRADRRNDQVERLGRRSLQELNADEREESDHEGRRKLSVICRCLGVADHLMQDDDNEQYKDY